MAITAGYRRRVKNVAAKKNKNYMVTFSSSEKVYDESQLLKSIFESLYAVTQAITQEGANPVSASEKIEQKKEIA